MKGPLVWPHRGPRIRLLFRRVILSARPVHHHLAAEVRSEDSMEARAHPVAFMRAHLPLEGLMGADLLLADFMVAEGFTEVEAIGEKMGFAGP